MRIVNGAYQFSPSDLIAYLECPFVSWLDRYDLAFPGVSKHEHAYLEELRAAHDVCDLQSDRTAESTRAAMQAGHPVIYQATVADGEFSGIADFLIRVPGASALGDYHYEVWDTKLARTARPYHAVQVCCYSEMLQRFQGLEAQHAGIILGNREKQQLVLADYRHYYKTLKSAFLAMQRSFDPNAPIEMPVRGEFRHWTGYVDRIRREKDDLTQVAGIRSTQITCLHDAGITSAAALAACDLDGVPGIGRATFERLRQQAGLQAASKGKETPVYRLVPGDPEQPHLGFGALPPASHNDIYFDMEGYPLAEGGLEYLFGASYIEAGERRFADWWAHNPREEKKAFEDFVRWAHSQWKADPAMHIYHYADYEKSALRRLSSRHATCEAEVDDLLRGEVFVDLYRIVRQALVVGEPSYSLKNIERLYRPPRTGEVANAAASIVYYQRWLDQPDGEDWRQSQTLRLIRDYNREDCESTLELAQWLRARQSEAGRSYSAVPTPEPRATSEEHAERARLAATMAVEADAIEDPEERRIHLLLGNLVEFHRREKKPAWWAYFDRRGKSEAELIEDRECLGGLIRCPEREVEKRSHRYRYRFPHQETRLREGKTCAVVQDPTINITIESIDLEARVLTFTRSIAAGPPPERMSLIPYEIIGNRQLAGAVESVARKYRASGHLPAALRDFLGRKTPRLAGEPLAQLSHRFSTALELAVEAANRMDAGSLVLQGPPGTGKTYTGARMIAALRRKGCRIGVMSNSHRAIALLLDRAAEVCRLEKIPCQAVVVDRDDDLDIPGVTRVNQASELEDLSFAPDLVGGTAWVFCRPEMAAVFDYLFIDEAGQVSLANLVAVSGSARNIVIIGDQCQLNQPIQGVHPGESGMSILEYYLGTGGTIDPAQGILLDKSFRMRPELCSFISDAIYEGRLTAAPAASRRRLDQLEVADPLPRTEGLLYVPVIHEGNAYESPEEAAAVADIVRRLLRTRYEDENGLVRHLEPSDILVVSPYNLQVLRLIQALPPGVRVGTVDKFQGQEAPVAIYSMTTSSRDEFPRGMEFLFSPNRMNVALSRAQVLAILIASPQLIRTDCRSLEQMKLVNLFCRAVEAGTIHSTAASAGAGSAGT